MASEPALRSSESAMIDAYVGAWTRGLGRRWTAARAIGWGAALALGPLLAVVADHNWPGGLPLGVIRGAGLGWMGGVLLAAAILLLLARLRRVNPLFAGRQLEQALAIPHNAVVNALTLRQAAHEAYAVSASAHQASRALRGVTELPAPPAQPRTVLRLAVLAVMVAWLAYSIVAPKSVWQSLLRFFGAALAPPTATQLELVRPGAGVVSRAGDPLELEFAVRGRRVESVLLTIDDAARVAESRSMQLRAGSAHGGATYWTGLLAANEVERDLQFVCRAGDAVLAGTIAVAPRPELVGLQVTLIPPAGYGEPLTTSTRDLTIWAGTQAIFDVEANTALREPVFVFRGESETRTRMQVDAAAPSAARASVTLHESGGYRIEFSDRWNTPYRDGHWYSINVRAILNSEMLAGSADSEASADGAGDAGGEMSAEAASGNPSGMGEGQGSAPGDATDQPGEPNGDDGDAERSGSSSGEEGDAPLSAPPGQGTPQRGDGDARSGSGSRASQTDAAPAAGDQPPEATNAEPAASEEPKDGAKPAAPGDSPGQDDPTGGEQNAKSDAEPGESGTTDGRTGAGEAGDTPGTAAPRGASGDQQPPADAPSPAAVAPATGGDGAAPPSAGGPPPHPGVGRNEPSDLLDRLARGEVVPESALIDLGLAPEAARSFAGELRRAQEAARRLGVSGPPRAVVRRGIPGDAEAQSGRNLSSEAGRGTAATESGLRDALARIAPPPDQTVPPQLQAVLEAYYRSLAAQRER